MKYFIYHFTYHTSVQTEHSVKSRIELSPNVSMENVHDIFEELIDNIITTWETHQNTTGKQLMNVLQKQWSLAKQQTFFRREQGYV